MLLKKLLKLSIMLTACKGLSIAPINASQPAFKQRSTLARIAANVKNRRLNAFVPSADDSNFKYKWKIFKNGNQIGATTYGANLNSHLAIGDYSLQLEVEDKTSHKVVSVASVKVHAT